jgi:hypothetical protein
MRLLLLPALVIAGLATGCYYEEPAYAPAYGAPGATVAAGAPAMEVISPGVQVVAVDYDYPVFFTDGFYWRFYGGTWYSSRWYDRGWAVNYRVPYGISRIDRPYAYAHYRGGAYSRGVYGGRTAPVYNGAGRTAPVYNGARANTPVYRAPARSYRPAATVHHK